MGLKKYKPVTPSRRAMSGASFEAITRSKPERSLLEPHRQKAGRNSAGRITVRHRGGGAKRRYRRIDFKREKMGIPGKVASVEYDPNRSAEIALLHYVDGEKRYIICPVGLTVGMTVVSGPEAEPAVGNALPVGKIPVGATIHNIELVPGRGGAMVRSAGQGAQVVSRGQKHVNVRLPSGEIRMVSTACMATIGRVGNVDHEAVAQGKAGRKRWLGIRPTVRGVAMNPVDHPMGGGEGRSSGGGHPVSPWGQLAKSGKTRKKRCASDKFIVQRRRKHKQG